jgi:hypothetical protein
MIINNNLDETVIMNIRDRSNLVDVNDLQLYDLNGTVIKPNSSIEFYNVVDSVFYFANISRTKVANLPSDMLTSNVVNLWDHPSDIAQCNEDEKCRITDNVVLKSQLPSHLIWYIYNDVTYLIIAMIFAILFATIAFVFINTIKK